MDLKRPRDIIVSSSPLTFNNGIGIRQTRQTTTVVTTAFLTTTFLTTAFLTTTFLTTAFVIDV